MQIREATAADIREIAEVHVASWRSTYAGIISDDFLAALSVDKSEQQWRAQFTNPHTQTALFVAADETGIIGFACGGPERDGHPVYKGELYAIYILNTQQGRGTGRRLIQAVAGHLVKDGITTMLIWALAQNSLARGFYERMGGTLVTEKPITIGGDILLEVGYGWTDIQSLVVAGTL